MGDFDCWRQKLLGLRSRSIEIRDSRLGLDACAGTASDPRPTPEPLFFFLIVSAKSAALLRQSGSETLIVSAGGRWQAGNLAEPSARRCQ